MAVSAPPQPPVEIDDGVIEEARRRQRRRRTGIAALIVAVAITGVILALAGGGKTKQHGPLSPYGPLKLTFVGGRPYLNGQLFPIAVRPGLDAQVVGLDVTTPVGGGASAYPERGTPLFGGAVVTSGTVGRDGEVDYFLTEPQVAAVRVPGIGTIKPAALPGLPPGIRIVVFYRPPGSRGTIYEPDAKDAGFPQAPAIVPVPLDANGHPIAATEPPSVGITLQTKFWQRNTTTPANGLCALQSSAAGARVQFGEVVTRITTPDYWAVGPAFLTCVASWYVVPGGGAFQAALLLNAQHPASPPSSIWGATPVLGHPGLVHLKPVTGRSRGKLVTLAPGMLARRDGDSWLVVQNGTLAQEIAFLNTLRITRLELAA